jgi:hypothetical protein
MMRTIKTYSKGAPFYNAFFVQADYSEMSVIHGRPKERLPPQK